MEICSGISTKWFFIYCFHIELEFRSADFCGGRKLENLEKNPWSKDEDQQQTQPTYDAGSGNRTRATLMGGERSHHCAIPAPPTRNKKQNPARKPRPRAAAAGMSVSSLFILNGVYLKIATHSQLKFSSYELLSIFFNCGFMKFI